MILLHRYLDTKGLHWWWSLLNHQSETSKIFHLQSAYNDLSVHISLRSKDQGYPSLYTTCQMLNWSSRFQFWHFRDLKLAIGIDWLYSDQPIEGKICNCKYFIESCHPFDNWPINHHLIILLQVSLFRLTHTDADSQPSDTSQIPCF